MFDRTFAQKRASAVVNAHSALLWLAVVAGRAAVHTLRGVAAAEAQKLDLVGLRVDLTRKDGVFDVLVVGRLAGGREGIREGRTMRS